MKKTRCLDKNDINEAAQMIKEGKIVAIPTETVYGLAANVFNEDAVKKIFSAKGRPADNPLIVHISKMEDLKLVASSVPEKAKKLIKKFWPGPLTIILPKKPCVPYIVTGGMESVAVRFPSHPVAQNIIQKSGVPLVAPSANLSGSPSPTKFSHVFQDLNGKADAIVNGGDCEVGVESTVISFLEKTPRLLRPGAITPEEAEKITGKIKIDDSVYSQADPHTRNISPGTKYKHYSPKAEVTLVKASTKKYAEFVNSLSKEKIIALCFEEDIPYLNISYISYGSIDNSYQQAQNLFSALRSADEMQAKKVYAHAPKSQGMGIAVYNRIVRAAGFNVIEI